MSLETATGRAASKPDLTFVILIRRPVEAVVTAPEIEGDVIRWIADRTRCTVTVSDGGKTQVARHESSADGVSWTASMDVTLRKVA
jgi:hypothetical protein